MKIQAAILTRLKHPLEIWELEPPPLQAGQVLVKMAFSGACHSQLNEIKGFKGEDKFLPHTLGHEGSGHVEAIGADVVKVSPGDPVVISWIKGAGADVSKVQYYSKHGQVNSGAVSTFLTYAIISENRVIPIPRGMPLKEAALLGCALPTGAGVVKNEMKIQAGQSFAVFGAGGVGLSALLAAKYAKAFPLIAIDVVEEKLNKAQQLGATHVINANHQDFLRKIHEITFGRGVDFVFESAGRKEAMEIAFTALAPGGLCVLGGNLPKGEKILIDPFELICGKRLVGTWGGGSKIDQDVSYYCDLYLNGHFELTPLITHVYPLTHINELFVELSAGRIGRGLISFLEDI